MIIKGVGIGRGVAVGPVIRMAQPLPNRRTPRVRKALLPKAKSLALKSPSHW